MAEIQKMTGFQSACAEFAEDRISLDKKFITNQAAMFPIALEADHKAFELKKGDSLIIDRSLDPRAGDLVIAVITNEFHVARYVIGPSGPVLMPFNKKAGDVELEEDFIWGVVASLHRRYR